MAILRDSESQLIKIHEQTESLQILAFCWVSTIIRVRVSDIRVKNFRVKAT